LTSTVGPPCEALGFGSPGTGGIPRIWWADEGKIRRVYHTDDIPIPSPATATPTINRPRNNRSDEDDDGGFEECCVFVLLVLDGEEDEGSEIVNLKYITPNACA